jgi:hypothetical protein
MLSKVLSGEFPGRIASVILEHLVLPPCWPGSLFCSYHQLDILDLTYQPINWQVRLFITGPGK